MNGSKVVLRRAQEILRQVRARRENYAAACEDYYRSGYIPATCFHGVNMWVDYDCACWMCETFGRDQLSEGGDYGYAIDRARQDVIECEKRMDLLHTAVAFDVPQDIRDRLSEWAFECISA